MTNADSIPISVEVLIDTSGSMKNFIARETPLARQFLNLTIRRGTDRAAVSAFGKMSMRQQDSTDELASLHSAINAITSAAANSSNKSLTSIYDAIVEAVNRLASAEGRKIVLVVTDGWENSSRMSSEKTIEALQKTDVAVYSISRYPLETNTMRLLAEDTGGITYSPGKDQNIDRGLRQVAREMASQQILTFQPNAHKQPNKFHNIRIETTRPELKGVTFKYRRRYYAN